MGVKITKPSTMLPVSVDDLKDHCRILVDDEDVLLKGILKAVVRQGEHLTGRRFSTCSIEETFDDFSDKMELSWAPVKIDSVKIIYQNSTGGESTLSTSVYTVDTYSDASAYIRRKSSAEWPDTYGETNNVRVQYVAGYTKSTVTGNVELPEDARLWVLMKSAAYYEQRESLSLTSYEIREISRSHLDALLDPIKLHNTRGWE